MSTQRPGYNLNTTVISAAMKKIGLNRQTLAEKSGIFSEYLGDIFIFDKGSVEQIARICLALDLNPDDILTTSGVSGASQTYTVNRAIEELQRTQLNRESKLKRSAVLKG